MSGDKEFIDRLLAEYKSPEEIIGLLKQLTKAIVERALQAESTTCLCSRPGTMIGAMPAFPAGTSSFSGRRGGKISSVCGVSGTGSAPAICSNPSPERM